MLKLHSLRPYKGATKRRKVVGRGLGSGHGTFSGQGIKGQKARQGGQIPVGFEGGNMPLQRQMPKKRGFTSRMPKAQTIRLKDLQKKFEANETVNPKTLMAKGLINSAMDPVKVLGDGEISKSLSFEKIMFSAQAREKVQKAGGKITEIAPKKASEEKA
jgi:large subunit ribosomal protein L15